MTTLTITETAMRDRLLADKHALETKLKDVFTFRAHGHYSGEKCAELVKSISAELRAVKAKLSSGRRSS